MHERTAVSTYLDLLDWRRQMAELFVELRRRPPDPATLAWFRAAKDHLFRTHPQSPLPPERRAHFPGLAYWPYDPNARVVARFVAAAAAPAELPLSAPEEMAFVRIGRLDFEYAGRALSLGAFWILGYAGGLFVSFRDATSGAESYGGGRYVLDTIKSADLGSDAAHGSVILDFNYAYHPSCVYAPHWACPLTPPENVLPIPVPAGERMPSSE
ncbi:MAG: DUF1684 domain-containing protein [Chloroflexi bacterium]|nr:DUF1684 domain-containing protein [Chloroflexota bacterium]